MTAPIIRRFPIDLKLNAATNPPFFTINQLDKRTVILDITLEDYDLTDCKVRLAISKPSCKTVFQDVTIVDGEKGLLEVELSTQSKIEAGVHSAELMISYDNGEYVAVSSGFRYMSTRAIMNDDTVKSQNEWSAIMSALEGFIGKDEAEQIINEIVTRMIQDGVIDLSELLQDYLTEEQVMELFSSLNTILGNHMNDTTVHITAQERESWNSRVTQGELTDAIGDIEFPSVEGLATEQFVTEAIENIEIPSVDGLLNEEQVTNLIDNAILGIDFPEGITEEEVRQIVNDSLANLEMPDGGVTEARVIQLINEAIGQLDLTVTWNQIQGVPAQFPPINHEHSIGQITGLSNELQNIRESIPAECTCENGGGTGEGGNCSCPSFPLPLNQINWQNGAINGHVTWTGGNVGLNFGTAPDGAGLQECGIQARSSNTSVLIRGSGRLDTLNRAFFFRPNNANSPTPQDMILFNDGRLNALMYSEDGVLLTDKYLQQDGFYDKLIEKQTIPQNSLNSNAPPSSYPMGISFYTTNDNTLGFPHPSLSIRTYRFANGRIMQKAIQLNGTQWERFGETQGWLGTGWQREGNQDEIENIKTALGGHSIWSGTQSEYDALTPNPNTLYFIV